MIYVNSRPFYLRELRKQNMVRREALEDEEESLPADSSIDISYLEALEAEEFGPLSDSSME